MLEKLRGVSLQLSLISMLSLKQGSTCLALFPVVPGGRPDPDRRGERRTPRPQVHRSGQDRGRGGTPVGAWSRPADQEQGTV